MYSKTSLSRPTMGPTLNSPFPEVVTFMELEYCYNGPVSAIVWDPNETLDIREWSICGGGQLERFCCILITT